MNNGGHNAQISIVVAGHVDHGKSTVIGRLLADIGALPQGRLEQVRAMCRRNARPFEYAFLLDALKDEQAQGITIDAARCFFHTDKRRYILIDAPGHVEFLKNMITGASRAEAALLVIDAREGIRENSKRHGYMLSMLGLRQLAVIVNKMDLVGYSSGVFEGIRKDYTAFLKRLGMESVAFIPVSGQEGVNIARRAPVTDWYTGPTVLEQIDGFQHRVFPRDLPLRLPVQGVYKFTGRGDDRRIVAGTLETGTAAVGDRVVFLPSGKKSRIKSVEYFNAPPMKTAAAGQVPGFTLDPQIYVKPGEWMVKAGETDMRIGTRFRANLFWMGRDPMIREKVYKLKLGAARSPLKLVEVIAVLDATELTTEAGKQQVDRHDVAEVVLETPKPLAFDTIDVLEQTSRLVVVDNYEIAGAGIILSAAASAESTLQAHIRAREVAWKSSAIPRDVRISVYGHDAKFVVYAGTDGRRGEELARALERKLFAMNFKAYYLGMENVARGLDADLHLAGDVHDDHVRRLGELARIFTDSGQIFITSVAGVDEYDLQMLALLNHPNEILVVAVDDGGWHEFQPSLVIDPAMSSEQATLEACRLLRRKKVIMDYSI